MQYFIPKKGITVERDGSEQQSFLTQVLLPKMSNSKDSNEIYKFFKDAQKEEHLMFDLAGYIASRLAKSGVNNITITGHDTYADEESFFSYRLKTHRNEPDYGRQISAIMIQR